MSSEQAKKDNKIGNKIREERIKQGLSLSALANATGLSKAYIGQVETGRTASPGFDGVARLCGELGIDPRDVGWPVSDSHDRDLMYLIQGIENALSAWARKPGDDTCRDIESALRLWESASRWRYPRITSCVREAVRHAVLGLAYRELRKLTGNAGVLEASKRKCKAARS
jgi:transcriptional regulator with XRE-family HTH domain